MDPFATREFLHVLSLEYRGPKAARIIGAISPSTPLPAAATANAIAIATAPLTPVSATNALGLETPPPSTASVGGTNGIEEPASFRGGAAQAKTAALVENQSADTPSMTAIKHTTPTDSTSVIAADRMAGTVGAGSISVAAAWVDGERSEKAVPSLTNLEMTPAREPT